MRSPVIAFGILAATVSPTLISGAPASPNLPNTGVVTNLVGGLLPAAHPEIPHARRSDSIFGILGKRADDGATAGGNAHTGNTNSASGGEIVNEAEDDETETNDASSTYLNIDHRVHKGFISSITDFGGAGDTSISGEAQGGQGDGRGPGGNAYTGNAGPARGGSIYNSGEDVDSTGGSSKSYGTIRLADTHR